MEIKHVDINYESFASKLYETCIFTDAWIDGKERFMTSAMMISSNELERLYIASEQIAKLYEEAVCIIERNSEFLDSYFGLTEYQKLMFEQSAGNWHGIARLDLFFLNDGSIRMCEMNSDTPSGEPEATVLNKVCREYFPECEDPNIEFENRFVATMLRHYELSTGKAPNADNFTVAIVYPTELTEDLSMIRLYQRWFENRGYCVVLGSPFNLKYHSANKCLYLMNSRIDLVLRHYKTDWWSERISVWRDSEFADSEPLHEKLFALFRAEDSHSADVFNPFGAVVSQNKLIMSFFYDYIDMFSGDSQQTIKSFVPVTRRLIDFMPTISEKHDWVLKSDYGCEGDEVVIGKYVSDDIWIKTLEQVKPEHWVVQKYFESIRPEGYEPNFGIYLTGGVASGIFTRLAKVSTDYYSLCVPTYIKL